ncbi:MAG: radical SAM protein [Candidatus Omnitrophica bacterium]|nr:radical SAM protein [Candidatus Omnitrophota bacterium]
MRIEHYFRLAKNLIGRKRPIYVHFAVTHRCSLRCRMCGIWSTGNEAEEISLLDINRIAEYLYSLGVVSISLGGGEPLERKDLVDIVRIFKKNKFNVRLLTNGIIEDSSKIKDLINAGLDEVSISLDILDPTKQDYICSGEGVWDKVVGTMKIFAQNIKGRDGALLVNTVVSKHNIKELIELAQFVKEYKFYISFIPLENNSLTDDGFKILKEDYGEVDKIYSLLIKEKNKRGNNIFNSTKFLEMSRNYFLGRKINNDCDAGELYLSISPEGFISFCHKFTENMALSLEDFDKFIKSQDYRRQCREFREKCGGCMRPCWREISFLSHDFKSFFEITRLKLKF